jgi:type II secretory ATPase GspE/PulE/Tfp pilus assembly ATPase PilB-like protein
MFNWSKSRQPPAHAGGAGLRRNQTGFLSTPASASSPVPELGGDSLPPDGGSSVGPANGGIVNTVADFPTYQAVLSGPDTSTPGLTVPPELQNKVLALRLSATRAQIAYDPAATAEVKPFLAPMRSELTALGMSVLPGLLLASERVLESVRLSAESKEGGRAGRANTQSDGTALFREWILAAKEAGGTDVHLRILDSGRGEVCMRIDGEMEPIPNSDRGLFTDRDVNLAMKAAYESLADRHSNNDGTFSSSKSMSCMIDGALGIQNLRVRFASQRGFFGPKAVCRLLPAELSEKPMPFAEMGFSADQIELLEGAQRLSSGIALQMGETGSGKTTAAKTLLEDHPRNGRMAIYQVADPIEYILRGVHQIYVQRDLMVIAESGRKDPYSEVIESLMRMDPDLVDVGEVRDIVSARALSNVGKSGHFAIGTLHAPSVEGAINRLTDPKLGLSRQELTSGKLLGFLSYQALMPVVCPKCAVDWKQAVQDEAADDKAARYLGWLLGHLGSIGMAAEQLRFRNHEGCSHCGHRGTKGLTMVAEMMMPEDPWLDLMAQGRDRDATAWWRSAHSDRNLLSGDQKGKLVLEHALFKAAKGMIDPRSVERVGSLRKLGSPA